LVVNLLDWLGALGEFSLFPPGFVQKREDDLPARRRVKIERPVKAAAEKKLSVFRRSSGRLKDND
jgi:hypothetical protein